MSNRLGKGPGAYFPYDQYRDEQKRILTEASNAIRTGTDVIVIDAPTGIGKSGINMTLAKWVGDAFYTTPQKHLRDQLTDDPKLKPMHTALRARADYTCRTPLRDNPLYDKSEMSAENIVKLSNNNRNCKECSINRSRDQRCHDFTPWCGYWTQKEKAMNADVAALTFTFLIYDTPLPTHTDTWDSEEAQSTLEPEQRQISFTDRDLLIVDEAHALEEQVASLHWSKTISRNTLSLDVPSELENSDRVKERTGGFEFDELYDEFLLHVYNQERNIEEFKLTDGISVMRELSSGIRKRAMYLEDAIENQDRYIFEKGELIRLKDELISLNDRLNRIMSSDSDSRTNWVLDTPEEDDPAKLVFRPTHVGEYLNSMVWSRADTIILSSATIPYQSNTAQWLERIGIDPDENTWAKISAPSPFPTHNRPISLEHIVGSLTTEGKERNEDEVVETIRKLANKHDGEQGLIHTVSYDWAETLHEHLSDIAMLHPNDDQDAKEVVSDWQSDSRDILLSPAMMEGVDLEGEQCRWQVLATVPYPNLSNPRVSYLKDEDNSWFYKMTAMRIVQSSGRAVRSKDDRAIYYVLDNHFMNMISYFPDWFRDAIKDR
jgi:Rad3-related DNA helicase